MNFEIAPKSTEIQLNWHDAIQYCFSLNIDGKTGWRLPTKKQLDEIYQSENDFEKDWYWSSTGGSIGSSWSQCFVSGDRYDNSKSYDNLYARAIRITV